MAGDKYAIGFSSGALALASTITAVMLPSFVDSSINSRIGEAVENGSIILIMAVMALYSAINIKVHRERLKQAGYNDRFIDFVEAHGDDSQ